MITSRATVLPLRTALFALVDEFCVAGALLVAVTMRLGWTEGLVFLSARLLPLVVGWMLFPIAFYVCGLYTWTGRETARSVLAPVVAAVCLGFAAAGAFLYAAWSPALGRVIVVESGLLLVAALMTVRFLYAQAFRGRVLFRRCLVVGTEELAEKVESLLWSHPGSGLKVVGVVSTGAVPKGNKDAAGYQLLGTLESLEAIVDRRRIDHLIVDTVFEREPESLKVLRMLRYRGVAIIDYVSLHEQLAREIPLDAIDDAWLLRAATSSSRLHIRRVKRLLDFVFSLVLLVPLGLVVMPLVALAVRLGSLGPILYRQERLGLGGARFMLLKFRTMFQDAEKLSGPVWSTDDDPRITPVGRVLRKFRLDELPQLFNVLRGEMSLVGPRPERPVLSSRISETVPLFSERLWVRPGITGWAQVMAPYAASVGDSYRKLQYDLYYTKNLSLALDADIMFRTLRTVLFGRERTQGGLAAGKQLHPSNMRSIGTARAAVPVEEPPAVLPAASAEG